MDHARQTEIIERLLTHVEQRTTAMTDVVRGVEISTYSSPELLAQEKQRFFREWPLVAGLSVDLAKPGDFLTQDMMGVPLLLVRGRDGVARAFVNVCRHRGAKVEGAACGSKKLFSCPFHAWGYDTEGALAAVPHGEAVGEIDRAALGLTPLPVAERHGLIWVRLDPGGADFDIDDHLGGLGLELAGWRLDEAALAGHDRFENGMNWKFAVDTFGETYHFEVLHKDSVNLGFFSNTQLYDIFGRNHRMVFAGRDIESLKDQPRQAWDLRPHSLLAYYLFPNTQLLIQRGGISLFRIFPAGDDPQRCVTDLRFYAERAPRSPDEAALAEFAFERTRDVIRDEDYAMGEMAQKSLATGAHRYAVFGRNEPALHHYHSTYRAALGLEPLPVI